MTVGDLRPGDIFRLPRLPRRFKLREHVSEDVSWCEPEDDPDEYAMLLTHTAVELVVAREAL